MKQTLKLRKKKENEKGGKKITKRNVSEWNIVKDWHAKWQCSQLGFSQDTIQMVCSSLSLSVQLDYRSIIGLCVSLSVWRHWWWCTAGGKPLWATTSEAPWREITPSDRGGFSSSSVVYWNFQFWAFLSCFYSFFLPMGIEVYVEVGVCALPGIEDGIITWRLYLCLGLSFLLSVCVCLCQSVSVYVCLCLSVSLYVSLFLWRVGGGVGGT